MEDSKYRNLDLNNGSVECLPGREEEIEKCRFCVHSVYFITKKGKIPSPARAFCNITRSTEDINLNEVKEVICDDIRGEGFRSMMNVIS
jgi:hypothetical protein